MHDRISDFPPAMSPLSRPPLPRLGADEFISDEQLALLIAHGAAERRGSLLVAPSGAMFVLREGLRVVGRAGQETDPYGFIGVIDTVGNMLKRGFVMSAERIALGRHAYDAEFGFILQPVGASNPDASGVNPKVG